MKETKIIGSIAIALALAIMGLNGGIAPVEAQDIAQTQQAISAGNTAGKLCGLCIAPSYCFTLILPLLDVVFSFMELFLGQEAIPFSQIGAGLSTATEQIATIGGKIAPESLAGIWNLAVVFAYKTLENSVWLFEMIPLIGTNYEGVVSDMLLPVCLGLIL